MVPRKCVPWLDEVFGTPDLAAPSPKDAKGSPPDVGATSNGLVTTVHAQDSKMDSAVPATKQDDAGADVPAWLPGMTAVLFDDRDRDQFLCRPVMVVDPESARETVGSSSCEGRIPVYTGAEYVWAAPNALDELYATPEDWSRLSSHLEASALPPPPPDPEGPEMGVAFTRRAGRCGFARLRPSQTRSAPRRGEGRVVDPRNRRIFGINCWGGGWGGWGQHCNGVRAWGESGLGAASDRMHGGGLVAPSFDTWRRCPLPRAPDRPVLTR